MGMAERVRAAVQTGPGRIELRDFPRPVTGPDDGLLRVEVNGICGSDVETFRGNLGRGRYPVIPGHEPVGVIEEVGERAAQRWGVVPGDRVALEVIVPCRACAHCLTGRYQACPHRTIGHGVTPVEVAPSLYGGFAEYLYLTPNAILHKIDPALPAELAALYNPLGAGVRWTCHLGGLRIGETVLILGCGQRGLAAVIAARAAGAGTIIVTGLSSDQHKLVLAKEFGADHTIVADQEDTVARVTELTDGVLADLVLELTPMAAGPVSDALLAARHGGRVVLAGLKGGQEIPVRTDVIVNRALSLIGAFGVDAPAYAEAIRIIESGHFPLAKLHTHSFGLTDVELAIQTLAGEVPGESAVHVTVHPGR